MNGIFDNIGDNKPYSLMNIYIRFTHLDIAVLSDLLGRIHKMHQTIVGVFNNSFTYPQYVKDEVRNVLHIAGVSTGNSITIKIREGWSPAFQPETDDFLLEIPKALGVPAIITAALVSTIDKMIVSNSNFLEETKRSIEHEIRRNPDCAALFNTLRQTGTKEKLDGQALELVQGAKSIDALRSVSVNGVNILSFDVNRRKHRRYFMRLPVRIGNKTIAADAVVLNISRGGCIAQLNEAMDMRFDLDCTFQVAGKELQPSEISMWRDRDKAFVRVIFNPPLEEDQFNEILNLSPQ
jgi:hypothetical protein